MVAGESARWAHARDQRDKLEAYTEVLRRLHAGGCQEARAAGFSDQLWLHFDRMPARYALDVNVERAEDVLMHKRLLKLAEDPANQPVFDIRPVQVSPNVNGNLNESVDSDSAMADDVQSILNQSGKVGNHGRLNLQANRQNVEDGDNAVQLDAQVWRPMHAITFSALDRRKLLSKVTALLAGIEVDIHEAHAFCTEDGFFLAFFIVHGWHSEVEDLRKEVEKGILSMKWNVVSFKCCSSNHTGSSEI